MPRLYSPESVSPADARQRLIDGNRRFLAGDASPRRWRAELEKGQEPFAVILGCSDSRAPAEIIFDQDLGQLFVIRIAGNVIAPSGVGSVEFAVAQFGVRFVVVLGHTLCGGIRATVESIEKGDTPESRHIQSITSRIGPVIEPLVRGQWTSREQMMLEAMRRNVHNSVAELRHGSALLDDLWRQGRVEVVGAELDLATGEVRFLDEPVAQK